MILNYILNLFSNDIFMLFFIIFLGTLLGKISFGPIKFGTSGVLIVALIMGHFKFNAPKNLQTLGIIFFLAAVGLIAGPTFMKNIKSNFIAFFVIALTILISSISVLYVCIKVLNIPIPLSLGLSSGALTSTASLASVIELTNSDAASVGYGIAYIFGVIGVILFVQLIPKFLHANIEQENKKLMDYVQSSSKSKKEIKEATNYIDKNGMFALGLTIALGVIIGNIHVKLGNNINFHLGVAGGSLISGLIISGMGRIGNYSLKVNSFSLNFLKDIGISIFLTCNGLKAGAKFVEVVSAQGPILFIMGAIMTLASASIAFIFAKYVFKFPLFGALAATTGAMTSAPSLNALLDVANDNEYITPFYAACQPIATLFMVLLPKIILTLMG